MLTKNHLKFTSRGGKVFPKYIKPDDTQTKQLVSEMDRIFKGAVGSKSLADLESQLRDVASSPVAEGLKKLLEDRCEFSDEDGADVENLRWLAFKASLEARRDAKTKEEFESLMTETLRSTLPTLRSQLYGDRPSLRKVAAFASIDASELIHRYNCAQIQGLLLQTKELTIEVKESEVPKKRKLLQKAKFHGLIMSVDGLFKDKMVLRLGGPLSVFEGASSYGTRLANFFPYVLQMDSWALSAQVTVRQKVMQLEVDSKKAVRSHYSDLTSYIPEDLLAFCNSLKENKTLRDLGWDVVEGNDVITVGKNNLVFPDLSFTNHKRSQQVHMEIFHKWHSSALKDRLQDMVKINQNNVIIAYPKKLIKDKYLGELTKNAQQSGVKIVEYSSFPTVRAVLAYLKG